MMSFPAVVASAADAMKCFLPWRWCDSGGQSFASLRVVIQNFQSTFEVLELDVVVVQVRILLFEAAVAVWITLTG